MLLLEKTTKKKKRRIYRYRTRVFWITVIVLSMMIIAGTIVLASMDSYEWLSQ
jgi:hypothetical protein